MRICLNLFRTLFDRTQRGVFYQVETQTLRGLSVLDTIFTPQIPYRLDDGDVDGKTGDIA